MLPLTNDERILFVQMAGKEAPSTPTNSEPSKKNEPATNGKPLVLPRPKVESETLADLMPFEQIEELAARLNGDVLTNRQR